MPGRLPATQHSAYGTANHTFDRLTDPRHGGKLSVRRHSTPLIRKRHSYMR